METPTSLDDLKDLLEENLEVAKENNRLLKRIRRDAFIGSVIKTVIWILVIGASLYFSYMLLAPYLSILEGLQGQGTDWQAIFDMYRGQFGQ